MVRLFRRKRKNWFRIEAYDENYFCDLLTGISKKHLVELREAIDLLLKWDE